MEKCISFGRKQYPNGYYSLTPLPDWIWLTLLDNSEALELSAIAFAGWRDVKDSPARFSSILESIGKVKCASFYYQEEFIEAFSLTKILKEAIRKVPISAFSFGNTMPRFNEIHLFNDTKEIMLILPEEAIILLDDSLVQPLIQIDQRLENTIADFK